MLGLVGLGQSAFYHRNDLEWASSNVPFIDVANADVLTAYYYRWRSYKKHIQQDPQTGRYVVTEFLPKVGWAGKDNTIPAAAGTDLKSHDGNTHVSSHCAFAL